MILAIDAGNTRIKWGVHDGRGWLAQGALGRDEAARLARDLGAFPGIRQAVISNVAGAECRAALQKVLDQMSVGARWVEAEALACGVSNGYARPGQLGSDRWAALIAAWHSRQAACVVACAGTALTVDALSSSGKFLGGLIVPGLNMMKTALNVNTAGVASDEGQLVEFPTATGDAVHSGALKAMAGAVDHMVASLAAREGAEPLLLLAGGDAQPLQAALSGAGEIVDNLVLEGLVMIAKEIPE
jgi:type III pantothenate kinase